MTMITILACNVMLDSSLSWRRRGQSLDSILNDDRDEVRDTREVAVSAKQEMAILAFPFNHSATPAAVPESSASFILFGVPVAGFPKRETEPLDLWMKFPGAGAFISARNEMRPSPGLLSLVNSKLSSLHKTTDTLADDWNLPRLHLARFSSACQFIRNLNSHPTPTTKSQWRQHLPPAGSSVSRQKCTFHNHTTAKSHKASSLTSPASPQSRSPTSTSSSSPTLCPSPKPSTSSSHPPSRSGPEPRTATGKTAAHSQAK